MLRVVRGDDRRSWGILTGRSRRPIDPHRRRQRLGTWWPLHEPLGMGGVRREARPLSHLEHLGGAAEVDVGRREIAEPTVMVRVDPDGSMTVVAEDIAFPNGTVIRADGRTLIVAETRASRLTAFDVADDGSLSNRRVWAQFDGVFPDGTCLDAEGAIWVADAGSNRVLHVFESGRIDRTISVGDQRAFACMLGGPERRTLFVCTSSASGDEAAQKTDGRIEVVEVDTPGAGLP